MDYTNYLGNFSLGRKFHHKLLPFPLYSNVHGLKLRDVHLYLNHNP